MISVASQPITIGTAIQATTLMGPPQSHANNQEKNAPIFRIYLCGSRHSSAYAAGDLYLRVRDRMSVSGTVRTHA